MPLNINISSTIKLCCEKIGINRIIFNHPVQNRPER
jgi:hypothetical protein